MAAWHRDGRLLVYGTVRTDSRRLSPERQRDMFDLMAAPLQKKVVSAANRAAELAARSSTHAFDVGWPS